MTDNSLRDVLPGREDAPGNIRKPWATPRVIVSDLGDRTGKIFQTGFDQASTSHYVSIFIGS